MKKRMLDIWFSRAPVERKAAAVSAVVIGMLLCFWFIHVAGQERSRLKLSVSTLKSQSASMEENTSEFGRLKATVASKALPATKDIREAVQGAIDSAGLSASLIKMDAPDAGTVQISFSALSFADWLAFTRNLQAQQIRIETCRIEALATAGLVSITATLSRARIR